MDYFIRRYGCVCYIVSTLYSMSVSRAHQNYFSGHVYVKCDPHLRDAFYLPLLLAEGIGTLCMDKYIDFFLNNQVCTLAVYVRLCCINYGSMIY